MFGRSGPITVLTSPFAAVSAAVTAEAAAAAVAAADAAEDKGMQMIACGAPTGQESSSDVSHQTNGLALGCASLRCIAGACSADTRDCIVRRLDNL